MEMQLTRYADRAPIDAYGDGGFRISGKRYQGGVIVSPAGVHAWPVQTMTDLTQAAFAPFEVEKGAVEILLVGTGHELAPLSPEADAWLQSLGIGAEVMATGAACRTFNVLLAEARLVAAALLPV